MNTNQNCQFPKFQWIQYDKPEICYVQDFLKQHNNQSPKFYKSLDLQQYTTQTKKKYSLNNTVDDIYRRILRHGQIDITNKVAKRTGAFKKQQIQARDMNYYDRDDPFIDDEQFQGSKNQNELKLAYAQYNDYNCFKGGIAQFFKSDIYRERLEILQNITKLQDVVPPKRKLQQSNSPLEQIYQKDQQKKVQDRLKKKVKKNPQQKSKEQVYDLSKDSDINQSTDKPSISNNQSIKEITFKSNNNNALILNPMNSMNNYPNQMNKNIYIPASNMEDVKSKLASNINNLNGINNINNNLLFMKDATPYQLIYSSPKIMHQNSTKRQSGIKQTPQIIIIEDDD